MLIEHFCKQLEDAINLRLEDHDSEAWCEVKRHPLYLDDKVLIKIHRNKYSDDNLTYVCDWGAVALMIKLNSTTIAKMATRFAEFASLHFELEGGVIKQ